MQFKSQDERAPQISSFPLSFRFRSASIWILFVAALALRAYGIKRLPLEFHPLRQYHGAFIARDYYYQTAKSIPEWKKQVAACNRNKEATLEPPILEHLAAWAYRAYGKERVWIPRLFSSIFWLTGGAFLYLLSQKMVSAGAALFSTAFYLFLPYGVIASRSFQPDPMMVMLMLASLYFMFLDHGHPSPRTYTLAVTFSALAILIVPKCSFAIFGAFISLAMSKQGFGLTVRNPKSSILTILTPLPATLYYLHGILTRAPLRFLRHNFFFPHLFFEPSYWLGWLNMIEKVVGPIALVAALVGVLLFREGSPRALLTGLWAGYFLFGLVFNYHIHTHDYYQLQLIPVVALSLGFLADRLAQQLAGRLEKERPWHATLMALAVFLSGLAAVFYFRAIWKPLTDVDRDQVSISQVVGERVNHTTRALCLSYAYGDLLEYHGDICAYPWPVGSDLRAERASPGPNPTVEERFTKMARNYSPEYFIVTDMDEYRGQPELDDFLNKNFPVLERADRYLIFDLRKRLSSNP